MLCVAITVLACSEAAFATGGSAAAAVANDPVGATLCRLTTNLTGNIAKAIATIAIFAVGVGLFMGKFQWGTAALTAAGVGVIFGSAQLVGYISGSAINSACTTQ